MASIKNFLILRPEDQEDRLDFDYYNPRVMKWVKYAHRHMNLNWTILSDLLIASTVGFVGKITDKYVDEGVKYITNKNVRPYYFDGDGSLFVTEEFAKEISHTRLVGGEVLVCRSGAPGSACVFPSESEAAVSGDILILRCGDDVLPSYLMLYINAEIGKALLSREISGSGLEHLNLSAIRNAKIPNIEKHKQSIIVDRFFKLSVYYRQLSEKLRIGIVTISRKRYTIIDQAFSEELCKHPFRKPKNDIYFLREDNLCERLDVLANHPDYTKLVAQIKSSPHSGTLSDLVDVSEERFNPDEHVGEAISYLAIGDIDGITGKIIQPQKILAEELPSRARRLIHAGDILVGIAGASTGTENMVVFPVTQEQEGWVATTGFLVLRPKNGVDIDYVCSLLKAPFVLRQIRALLTSPAMPTISNSDFMQLAVPVTNSDTRKKTLLEISRIVSDERELTVRLEAISRQIEQLLAEAKSNIFDLLDDAKFSSLSARAREIEAAMADIEAKLP